jgi:hypothetical protein
MAYRIAGIDVHKKMWPLVVADVESESEYQFERRQFGTTLTICDCYRNGSSSRRSRKWWHSGQISFTAFDVTPRSRRHRRRGHDGPTCSDWPATVNYWA